MSYEPRDLRETDPRPTPSQHDNIVRVLRLVDMVLGSDSEVLDMLGINPGETRA